MILNLLSSLIVKYKIKTINCAIKSHTVNVNVLHRSLAVKQRTDRPVADDPCQEEHDRLDDIGNDIEHFIRLCIELEAVQTVVEDRGHEPEQNHTGRDRNGACLLPAHVLEAFKGMRDGVLDPLTVG